MTKIIDGTKIAENLRKKVHSKVKLLKKQYNFVPGLAVIIVGNDPASKVYVKNKIVFTKEVGMNSYEYKLDEEISQKKLVDLIRLEHLDSKFRKKKTLSLGSLFNY